MQNGKKMTLEQKKWVALKGLQPEKYLLIQETSSFLIIMEKNTGKERYIMK